MRRTDINIVGAGPVGLITAVLLGRAGLSVDVFERWPSVFSGPRACGLDHEALRILQSARLMDSIGHLFDPVIGKKTYEFQNAAGARLLQIQWNKPGVSGWAQMNLFHQPDLDAAIDRQLRTLPNVQVHRCCQAVGLEQDDAEVRLTLRSDSGELTTAASRFLIGADGANSTIRDLCGIKQTDLGFQYDWLVVDALMRENQEWAPYVVQRCDPSRPATAVGSGPGRRRWEFMRLPGESIEDLNQPETAWKLLAEWGVTPENAALERSAVYTFRGRWADQWRDRRVILAGDAAHLMPPFLAQGLCSGIRDAISLAWRLPYAIDGQEWLLDSYGPERLAHSRELIEQAVELGRAICILDPKAAAQRDQQMLEALADPTKAVRPPPQPRLGQPGLFIADDSRAGFLFPQGRIALADGNARLFDDVFQPGWQLIYRVAGSDPSNEQLEILTRAAECGLRVVGIGLEKAIADVDGVYREWFTAEQVDLVIVRPDFYVFGAATWSEASQVVEKFTQACGTAVKNGSHVTPDSRGAFTEICQFRIREGQTSEFEHAFSNATDTLLQANGYIRHRIRRKLEDGQSYVLEVCWKDLASHVLDFRGSHAFRAFGDQFAHTLQGPPSVYHLAD